MELSLNINSAIVTYCNIYLCNISKLYSVLRKLAGKKTLNVLEVTDNPANAGEHTCCHLLKAQKWRWWCEELHFVWNSAAFLVPKKEVTGWGQHLLLSRLSLAWTWQHIKRNMALQYPQNFLLLSKRKKLACSRSINLIIFVIDRCLWRPSKAQKDEKLISIFKNAAFGRGRLQWWGWQKVLSWCSSVS